MRKPANLVVFACNWDGWSCVEAAGSMRLSYPASIKVIRVSCLSSVHTGLMLKAIELGADGVMLLGCQSGNCHYSPGGSTIIQQYEKARDVLKLLRSGEERFALCSLPYGDGAGFVKHVRGFLSELEKIPAII